MPVARVVIGAVLARWLVVMTRGRLAARVAVQTSANRRVRLVELAGEAGDLIAHLGIALDGRCDRAIALALGRHNRTDGIAPPEITKRSVARPGALRVGALVAERAAILDELRRCRTIAMKTALRKRAAEVVALLCRLGRLNEHRIDLGRKLADHRGEVGVAGVLLRASAERVAHAV